jgi:hypothetical protein
MGRSTGSVRGLETNLQERKVSIQSRGHQVVSDVAKNERSVKKDPEKEEPNSWLEHTSQRAGKHLSG